LQRKLAIGASNDPLEAEADRAADAVMQMRVAPPIPHGIASSAASSPSVRHEPTLRRSRSPDEYRDLESDEQNEALQRKSTGEVASTEAPAIVHEVLRSPGRPLDAETRSFMEARFSHDFSRVRIHTDGAAAHSATAVSALAYTAGNQVVFGAGQYAPSSSASRRLLAHELAHVVQQGQGCPSSPSHKPSRRSVPIAHSASVSVQRQEIPQSTDDIVFASIIRQGMTLKASVEQTHWGSEAEKRRFIRNFLSYAREHNLTAQYEQAIADYPNALPGGLQTQAAAPRASNDTGSSNAAPTSKPASKPATAAVQQTAPATAPMARAAAGASEWTLGPRGEHLPTSEWKGGTLRPIASYTKPWAQDLARAGNYEAAELAENYLCASCHILTKVAPQDFDLNGYTLGWQKNYIQGLVEAPLMATPVGAAWEIGVSGGQAITGEGSGLHISNISNMLVYHRSDLGQKLTPGDRALEGVNFLVGAILLGHGAVVEARAGVGVPTPKPVPKSAYLVEGPHPPTIPAGELPPPLPSALDEAAGGTRAVKPPAPPPPRRVPKPVDPTVRPPLPPKRTPPRAFKPVDPAPSAARPKVPSQQTAVPDPQPTVKVQETPVEKAPAPPPAKTAPRDPAKAPQDPAAAHAQPAAETEPATEAKAASQDAQKAPAVPKEERLEQIRQERAANDAKIKELDEKINAADKRANEAGDEGTKARGDERTRLQEKARRNRATADRLTQERREIEARNRQLADEAAKLDPPPLPKPKTWQEAEDVLRKEFGGQKVRVDAGELGVREIDCLTPDGISREAKFGPQGLSKERIELEINKDVALVKEGGRVKSVEWHFYRNVEGDIGPSGPLRAALEKAGIKIVFHY
jgi:hypothetical protein